LRALLDKSAVVGICPAPHARDTLYYRALGPIKRRHR
jgi:hypothetical protein